jgi:hypothetical protein
MRNWTPPPKKKLAPYVVAGRIPYPNFGPCPQQHTTYHNLIIIISVFQKSIQTSELSRIFISEYFTSIPTDVFRNWKIATFATSETAVPVIITG